MVQEEARLQEIKRCQSVQGGAFSYFDDLKSALDKNRGILIGAANTDEECCLVCGDADYEDDNLIGYCDKCGLSVHNRCYGLKPDAFEKDKEFVCYGCKAFGDKTMQVACVLCQLRGGAMKPVNCRRDRFLQELVAPVAEVDNIEEIVMDTVLLEENFTLGSDDTEAQADLKPPYM